MKCEVTYKVRGSFLQFAFTKDFINEEGCPDLENLFFKLYQII